MLFFWWIYSVLAGGIVIAAAIDIYFGMRQVAELDKPEFDKWPAGHPRVAVIVPARNEEKGVGPCLRSLAAQDYPDLEVIAVNDRSTDGTQQEMQAVADSASGRIRVIHITELPAGWLGKTHAMWTAAKQTTADWLLFTDGDVLFEPSAIRRAVAYAEAMNSDQLTVLPRMLVKSVGEAIALSVVQFAFGAVRPWKLPDPKSWSHCGIGAFNMVRRSVYESLGTFEVLRFEVVEDMKLGQLIKRRGYAARFALGHELVSLHWASGIFGIAHNLTKNTFAALRFRWYWALAGVIGIAAVHVLPFVLVWFAPGWTKLGFGLCLAGLFAFYPIFWRVHHISPVFILTHPIAGLVMIYTVLRAVAVPLIRGEVVWRGTRYPLKELRKAMEGK